MRLVNNNYVFQEKDYGMRKT